MTAKKRPGATLEPQTVAGVPKPEPVTNVVSTVLQWLLIFGIIAGAYFGIKYLSIELPSLNLLPYQVVLLSFCFAFTWVYIFKWGSVKPFNCVTCMSGWFALIIGYWCFGWMGIALMPVAMTTAAIYSEVRMRWL
jgi:hypothetical protein